MLQVKLSSETVKSLSTSLKSNSAENLPLIAVIHYLNDDSISQKLRVFMLQDMISSFEATFKKSIYIKPSAAKLTWKKKIILALGITSGLINAISDAFGNISVLLITTFDALTAGFALLWASLAFALFCAAAFLLFRLAMISKSTNISIFKVGETLSAYLEERRMLNELLRFMDIGPFITHHDRHGMNLEVLQGLKQLLTTRGKFLKIKSQELAKVRQGYFPTIVRGFLITSLSVWSLTSGFMTGFFELAMISAMVPAVIIPVWGCVLCGLLIGIATLYMFWSMARAEVTEGVDYMIGADEESIKGLAVEADMDLMVFNKPKPDGIPQAPTHQENYQSMFEAANEDSPCPPVTSVENSAPIQM